MTKLHELLAAEKTPTAAWNTLFEDTIKKFKNAAHFFEGHSKSLKMAEESVSNTMTEEQNREEKPVTTNVYDTLEYALDIFGKSEDLQVAKNKTNQRATGTVRWRGTEILTDLPVDQLLGLEARLSKIRTLFAEIPTLDATKTWAPALQLGAHIWQVANPDVTTKTEKTIVPLVMSAATDKHPAQIEKISRDNVVGKVTTVKRSGAATASQKAEAIKVVDELLIEIKQARMRANETVVEPGTAIAATIISLLLAPLKTAE